MPSLISATERANLTGIFNDIFDTFQRPILVVKEPLKVRRAINSENFTFGFGDQQGEDAYTYIDRTGQYPATVRYANSSSNNQFKNIQNTQVYIPDGMVSIKVKKDCRDFINDGPTARIEFDGRVFSLDSDERKQMFLDSEFWIFILRPIK